MRNGAAMILPVQQKLYHMKANSPVTMLGCPLEVCATALPFSSGELSSDASTLPSCSPAFTLLPAALSSDVLTWNTSLDPTKVRAAMVDCETTLTARIVFATAGQKLGDS